MTEREYLRLREHIATLNRELWAEPVTLSKATFEAIWEYIAASETGATDYDELLTAASRAKGRLLEYVEQNGPFVFENGRCLFIDVGAFQLTDWQWSKIPVRDVTSIAQRGFLTDFQLDPQRYLRQHWPGFALLLLVVIGWVFLSC